MLKTIKINTRGQGLYEITNDVRSVVKRSNVADGVCSVFVQHTSASLIIQENADPSAKADLESWLNRLVPENDPIYTHTLEGADDMPAHLKAALTASNLSIPVSQSDLLLGTWQGIYLWEHRNGHHNRSVIIQV